MKVFTTGQVAKICKVVTRTVMLWVDSGKIEGCYRLPGSSHRRIPEPRLVEFLAEHGMPTLEELEKGKRRGSSIVTLDLDPIEKCIKKATPPCVMGASNVVQIVFRTCQSAAAFTEHFPDLLVVLSRLRAAKDIAAKLPEWADRILEASGAEEKNNLHPTVFAGDWRAALTTVAEELEAEEEP